MKLITVCLALTVASVRLLHAEPAGSIDPSFQVGTISGSTLSALVPLANNKVLAGGSFSSWNGISSPPLVRLHADGTRDHTFVAPSGSAYSVRAVTLKADGKILMSGNFQVLNNLPRTNLVQLLPDGAVDENFEAHPDNYVADMLEISDGRILITGAFDQVNGIRRSRIALLLPNGEVDESWFPEGGLTGLGESLHLLPEKGIYASGLSWSDGFQTITGLVRILTNGSIDRTFDLGSPSFFSERLFPQEHGTILLQSTFYPTRVLANDALDQHFVNGTGSSFAAILAVQPDGRMFFSGTQLKDETGAPSTFLRAYADGRIDPSFKTQLVGAPAVAAVRQDGKILVAGYLAPKGDVQKNTILLLHGNDENAPATVQWYASSLDAIHNGNISVKVLRDGNRSGTASVNWSTAHNPAAAEITPSMGTIVFSPGEGYTQLALQVSSSLTSSALINFDLADLQGAVFGTNKLMALNITNEVSNVVLNSATVTTVETQGLFSFSLNRDGALNRPVAVGWRLKSSGPEQPEIVLRSGVANFPAGRDFAFVSNRTLDDARVDGDVTNEFEVFQLQEGATLLGNTNGVIIVRDNDLPGYPGRGADHAITMAARLRDGGLLLLGSFNTIHGTAAPRFARLTADGAINPNFNPIQILGTIYDVSELPDGKILIAGSLRLEGEDRTYSLLRLQPNGQLDESFIPDMLSGAVSSVAVTEGGILLTGLSGSFNGSLNGTNLGAVVRIDFNGKKDLAFSTPTAATNFGNTFLPSSPARVQSLDDGKFFVYGNIIAADRPYSTRSPLPETRNVGIARFHPNGALDTAFQTRLTYTAQPGTPPSTAVAEMVRLLQPYPDGHVLIAGAFTSVNSRNAPGIARLLPNGELDLSFQTNLVRSLGSRVNISEMALLPNGEILVAIPLTTVPFPGQPAPVSGVIRLYPNGNRKDQITVGTGAFQIGTILTYEDGRAFLGSNFTALNGQPAYRMAWLNADGTVHAEPGTLVAVSGMQDGTHLTIHSVANGTFDLQHSENLETWTPVRTVQLSRGSNPISLPRNGEAAFYRVWKR